MHANHAVVHEQHAVDLQAITCKGPLMLFDDFVQLLLGHDTALVQEHRTLIDPGAADTVVVFA